MHSINLKRWIDPSLLLLIAIFAFGLYIPQLGLFGDDWPHLWVLHMFGLEGLNHLVAWDRPFSAWVYALIAPIAGENIWAYHVYLLFLRWFCAVIFYYLLDRLFPDTKPFPFWTAALFLVYPGFRQQPQPLEFILHFTALAFLLASFWFMVKAIQDPSKAIMFHSIGVLMDLSIFSIEYFIGLELIRPFLLWISLENKEYKGITKAKNVFANWSPYFLIICLYAYWRNYIFKFPTYKPTFLGKLGSDPIASLTGLGQILAEEIRAAVLGAWRQIISLPQSTGIGWVYVILVLTGFVLCFLVLTKKGYKAEGVSPFLPLGLGCLAIIAAGIPFWITGIPVQLEFPWDRSTLPFMFGASLFLSGLFLLLKPGIRNLAASIVIALCIGMHFQNSFLYQTEWEKLSQFFWQLTWRAPDLKPGTIIVSDEIPILYYGDNNLTPVLNWTYAPEQNNVEIAYNFFDMGERLGKNLPELKPGLPVSHGYRFVNFKSNSNSLLPVYFNQENCLKIVDEQLSQDKNIPDRLIKTSEFSKPNLLIQTSRQATPPDFIPEPEHGWCFFYQKAGLAAQMYNWAEIGALYDETTQLHISPTDYTEWLPFIEGLIQTNRIHDAEQLSEIGMEQEDAKPVICGIWNYLESSNKTNEELNNAREEIGCK